MPQRPSRLWSSFSPTRIEFGSGALAALGRLAVPLGTAACLVGSDSSRRTGTFERCRRYLDDSGIKVIDYPVSISPDPTVHEVNSLAGAIGDHPVEFIVAVGGGSVLDCVKAAAVLVLEGGTAQDRLTGDIGPATQSLPVVAVPTTGGTGAELSKGAILTWPERGIKGGMRGEALLPAIAVVDPMLTTTVPPDQTRYTGFDAFAHAIETYVSIRATPMTELFSSVAVTEIVRNLPRALEVPDDLHAREQLSFHAMLMGYNLANSSTCLPHRLQYAIGFRTKAAHGLGLAALLPTWVNITRDVSPDRFAAIAGWIGDGLGRSLDDIAEAVSLFIDRIDLRRSLSDLGIHRVEVSEIAHATAGSLENDPWWNPDRDLEKMLNEAFLGGNR